MKKFLVLLGSTLLVALVVGVSIPGSAGAATVREGSGSASDGQAVFLKAKCNMCHDVSTVGITAKVKSAKMKGPDLVNIEQDAAWIGKYLKHGTDLDGKKHKKKFSGSDTDLQALIDWLLEQKS